MRLQLCQGLPVGGQIPVHFILRETAEGPVGGAVGDVGEVVGRGEQVVARKARDAGHEYAVEQALIVLQCAEEVLQRIHCRPQVAVRANVFHNGGIVLVHQDHG